MLSVLTKRKPDTAEPTTASTGLWQLAMRRLKRDRIADVFPPNRTVLFGAVNFVIHQD